MARKAIERGYEYLAITDHSASHGFGNHVTADQLRAQIERVRALNATLDGFELLIGTEVNILPDGSLDYPDELLAAARLGRSRSVHTSFAMGEKEMTARMVAACEHPYVDAIGHATGRKIETREPYALDVHQLIEAAARTGTMLEINSAADRRDLNDVHARAAAEPGVLILDRLRRARRQHARHRPLGRRDRAPRLARARAGRQHAAVGGVRAAAQARPRLTPRPLPEVGSDTDPGPMRPLRPGQDTVLSWAEGAVDCRVVAAAGGLRAAAARALRRPTSDRTPSGRCSLTYLDGMIPMGWDGTVEPGSAAASCASHGRRGRDGRPPLVRAPAASSST